MPSARRASKRARLVLRRCRDSFRRSSPCRARMSKVYSCTHRCVFRCTDHRSQRCRLRLGDALLRQSAGATRPVIAIAQDEFARPKGEKTKAHECSQSPCPIAFSGPQFSRGPGPFRPPLSHRRVPAMSIASLTYIVLGVGAFVITFIIAANCPSAS